MFVCNRMPVTMYVHLTWTTFRNRPLIDGGCAKFLRQFLKSVASRYGADAIDVGIVSDHIHMLLMLPSVIDIPRLVQGLKGASARVANRDKIVRGEKLRWARGYDLRSVSPQALPQVSHYIRNQAQHHPLSRIHE